MYKPQKVYYPHLAIEKLVYAAYMWQTLSFRQQVNAYNTFDYYTFEYYE